MTTSKTHGTTDPTTYPCTCPAQAQGGSVLLFYRYWANAPVLPPQHSPKTLDTKALAAFHSDLAEQLHLGGKFRIATEGLNITLGGTASAIAAYIEQCRTHWSFSGIDLSTSTACDSFFKPTPGCACAFSGKASVRVTAEITPLGITNYAPASWSNVVSLSPARFHDLCEKGDIPLVDVRNHYESRIGYFVSGNGDVAVRPAVRRFSQWPGYVVRHILGNDAYRKPEGIATYCTGGIRCEKGARWMQEALAREEKNADAPVYTLHGGIVAYQAWMQAEVDAGRKKPEDSFFKGRNYVFDGRGAIGAHDDVATCHGCGRQEGRLGKCGGDGCYLDLVICKDCEETADVRCCNDCRQIDSEEQIVEMGRRRMCQCERDREKSLWGDGGARLGGTKVKPKTKAR
ncbi:hypothetical protein N0V90_003438 [Kalmusia sp. IMI 367209]|nr:hypothetical protein N0V90_003438 [Kalmusia sp. IMI 367209]